MHLLAGPTLDMLANLQVERNLMEELMAKMPGKYALVIDGKALLYALSPKLRDLFLRVGGVYTSWLTASSCLILTCLPKAWH